MITASIALLLSLIGIAILSLTGFLWFEVLTSLLPQRKFEGTTETESKSIAILVPAHNEAAVIHATLTTLRPQLRPIDQLIVVADNCTDNTGDIARSLGATVLERDDHQNRGKGYALDFGLREMASNPPDIVIIIDADCMVQPNALNALREQVVISGKPAQAVYLMEQPTNPSPKDQVSAFAFKVKNLVRPRGLTKFGLPCPLTGTGMAFPWQVIAEAKLASGNIVEDMKLGVDLAIAGYPTLLCSDACVLGQLPSSESASTSQRTRWEHGHLQTLLTYVPQLFGVAIQKRRFDLLFMAIDLAIPPLALLVMVWLGCSMMSLIVSITSSIWISSIVLAIAGSLLVVAILTAWMRFGKDVLSLQQLLSIPLYILWKIPLYFKFLVNPQRQWIRTEREPSSDSLKS